VVKELTIVGSRCGPFDKAMALLRSGQVDLRPLISHTLPLDEAPAAILLAQKPGVMKVFLRNDGNLR
jgi:threonine dehydrogenase-like Zn-dependent dehydrogenase